jgi:hypothetical protein
LFTYSLCQASYKTYGRSKQVRDYWLKQATKPERVQHCLGFEFNDTGVSHEYGIESKEKSGITKDGKTLFETTEPQDTVSAVRNWNASASLATGNFLIAIADDLVPNPGWDEYLDVLLRDFSSSDIIVTFTDDRCYRLTGDIEDTLLPRHPLMSQASYKRLGYLFNPMFNSVGPDFDLLILSLKEGMLIDGRGIKFHHSIGPILSLDNELLCGCKNLETSNKKTRSQTKIHTNSRQAWEVLELKWGRIEIALGKLACVNRIASYVYSTMQLNKRNSAFLLIVGAITKFACGRLISAMHTWKV